MHTEEYLIALAARGDREAAGRLIEKHYNAVYRYIFLKVDNRDVAMELTQETFIGVLKGLESFDIQKSSFKTWVMTIAKRRTIDYYRSKEQIVREFSTPFDELDAADERDFVKSIENRETLEEINQILAGYDAVDGIIIRMKCLEGYSFKEISQALGKKDSYVKARYYSVIKKIRKEMAENEKSRLSVTG